MTDATTPLAERRDRLVAEQAEAEERAIMARRAMQADRFAAPKEVTQAILDFQSAILYRRADATPEAERPARLLELSHALLDDVRERGLVIQIEQPSGALRLLDPALEAEYDAANEAHRRANGALKVFDRDHGAELDAEVKAADAKRIRDALSGDDGDKIREVLATAVV